jgi:ferredoxin, 2Fe-2S
MLEMADDVQPNSRLACQIQMTEELDGLVLRMPGGNY